MKISAKQYARLIFEEVKGLGEKQIGEALKKVAALVKKNRDEKKLKQIVTELNNIIKTTEGVIEGEVVSTKKLGEEMTVIKEKLADKYETEPEKVKLKNIVDKTIKGGIIIKAENDILDGSILNKLSRLRERLS
jgi:F-type H+-transporting ATPase subunit delta